MTGIEKIIAKIEQDSRKSCDDIIRHAKEQAQAIINDAERSAKETIDEALRTAKEKCENEIRKAVSKAEIERKKAILKAKTDIINEIIGDAVQKLKNLPDEDYFIVIGKLICNFAQNGLGILGFSEKDLKRIPDGFEAKMNNALGGGRSIKISSKPVAIDGGVIISYDEIEQNCSFDALLNASLDKIKDELYQMIFMRNSI